jgi:tetratricopeptide (TPR) repeat protein
MAPLYVRTNGRAPLPRPAASQAKAAPKLPGMPTLPVGTGSKQLEAGISLCMIVKDEERFLEACLRSAAPYVDEICIVDTGSTDRTLEIAASFGARVVQRPWRNDFAWARNEALALARRRWILVLDADEELDASSRDCLRTLRDQPAALTGLWVRCNNLSDDYKGTGVSSHALVRFFPNNPRIRYMSPVHEFITLDNKSTGIDAKPSPLSITHHGYLSEIVKTRKKSERNLELVKTATENDPDEPFNWYNLGTTSLLCDLPDEAIVALEKMRELVGESQRGFVPNALAQLADLYSDRGRFAEAIDAAQASLRKAPHFANAHFALGRALAKQQRYAEARTAFEAAIADAAYAAQQFIVDDEVSIWKAQSEIGSAYGHEGDNEAALVWFERALANRPAVIPVRMNRAKALERLGRFDEAGAAFKEIAADEPGDVHSVDYINFLLRRAQYADAVEAIETALPYVSPRVQATLLVTAAKLGQVTWIGSAESYLERAVAAHPGAADALDGLEGVYRARGDHEAIRRLHAAELDAPLTLPPDYARRGTRYLGAGMLAQAEEVTRAGLAIAPMDPDLRYNLGAVLVQTGRKEAALEELRAVPPDGAIGVRALFLRSIISSDLGLHTQAIEAINAVIARAPAEVDARLHCFRLHEILGDDESAESTLRSALRLGDARVAAEFASWLLRKGRFHEAKAVAEEALAAV